MVYKNFLYPKFWEKLSQFAWEIESKLIEILSILKKYLIHNSVSMIKSSQKVGTSFSYVIPFKIVKYTLTVV